MTGEIAQLCALVSYGNAALRGLIPNAAPIQDNFTFEGSDVRFVLARRSFWLRRERDVAASAVDWIGWLERGRCLGLTLLCVSGADWGIPEHISVAFAGGGARWIVSTRFTRETIRWTNQWNLATPPPRTHWSVRYRGEAVANVTLEAISVQGSTDRLREIVMKARDFAASQAILQAWVTDFDRALEALQADTPESVRSGTPAYARPIVAVEALALPARRLFAAAQHAWVFGGMGSWNDVAFDDAAAKAMYEEISGTLYAAVNAGITAAVNTSDGVSTRSQTRVAIPTSPGTESG